MNHQVTIPENTLFNETTEEFIDIPETTITIAHSLLSIEKWEAKYHKPFLTQEKKTAEEFLDYIRFMTITKNVNPNVYYGLTPDNLASIQSYMEDDHTATWFREDENDNKKGNQRSRAVTAELIYCWMIELRMPIDIFQKWHVGRLIVLIRTCQEERKAAEGDPKKKLDMNKRRALMERRRAKYRKH